MKHIFCSCLFFLLLSTVATAQDAEIDKKIEKAEKALNNNKTEDAEKQLIELVKKYPWSGKVWDKLAEVQLAYLNEKSQYDGMFTNVTITSKDAKGNIIENDTNVTKFMELMGGLKPSELYKKHMINTYRLACCYSSQAYYPSMLLRMYLVDPEVDKNISAEAKKEYQKAEKEFHNRNFNSAAKYYQKAIEIEPNYYKARLYLGDVYYFTKHYDLAIEEFKRAVSTQPTMLEPRKYLFDALTQSGEYKKAYQIGIDAINIYPDLTMKTKVEHAASNAGVKCDIPWLQRDVLPNRINNDGILSKDDIKIDMPKNSPWRYYTEALEKVEAVSDKDGILKENEITTEKYLELYSWQYMLGKASAEDFKVARQMKEKGFLDCYVFISCFHNDFYAQYKDFIAKNPQRVQQYFELLAKMD